MMSFKEPRPGSPARLRVNGINTHINDEGGVSVTVTMDYMTWCCEELHELSDAARAVERLFRRFDPETYDPSTAPEEVVYHKENTGE